MTDHLTINPVADNTSIRKVGMKQPQQQYSNQKPDKPTPVKTVDFWNPGEFELNEYEERAAKACCPCKYCCCCFVVPGTLDHCCLCLPANCHNACSDLKDDRYDHLIMTCLHCPCNMICGPLYCCYHTCKVCQGNPHRYNRTVNYYSKADDGDCQKCDCNRYLTFGCGGICDYLYHNCPCC